MASAERLDASLASFEAALAVEVAAVSRPPAPPREWHFRRSRGAAAAAGAAAPRSPLVFLPPLGVPCAAYFHRVAASLAAKGYSVLLPEVRSRQRPSNKERRPTVFLHASTVGGVGGSPRRRVARFDTSRRG